MLWYLQVPTQFMDLLPARRLRHLAGLGQFSLDCWHLQSRRVVTTLQRFGLGRRTKAKLKTRYGPEKGNRNDKADAITGRWRHANMAGPRWPAAKTQKPYLPARETSKTTLEWLFLTILTRILSARPASLLPLHGWQSRGTRLLNLQRATGRRTDDAPKQHGPNIRGQLCPRNKRAGRIHDSTSRRLCELNLKTCYGTDTWNLSLRSPRRAKTVLFGAVEL